MDNLKKWMDIAQQFQGDGFWSQVFKSNSEQSTSFNIAKEYFPKCDIYQADQDLIIEIEIPGLRKEDVQISINQQILTVTGEFKTLETSRKYYLKERANHKFKKELSIPCPVHISKSKSELENGILIIRMPLNTDEMVDIPIKFNEQAEE